MVLVYPCNCEFIVLVHTIVLLSQVLVHAFVFLLNFSIGVLPHPTWPRPAPPRPAPLCLSYQKLNIQSAFLFFEVPFMSYLKGALLVALKLSSPFV